MDAAVIFANANVENLSIFDPASPSAASIRDLAIFVFAITAGILVIVEAVLIYSVFRFRRTAKTSTTEPPQVYGSHPIEIAWTAAPALIVFILVLVVARTEWDVQPNTPTPVSGDQSLFVTVVGRQWWWEYRYEFYDGEKLDFITANELHLPASDSDPQGIQRPIHLKLVSADVCHSFWVPRLAGKMDLIPGRTNRLWFQTAEKGLFLGQCAEFCGTQHAKMLLRVQVDSPEDFKAWLANQKKPAREPENESIARGKKAFMSETCVNCHRIVGTPAKGDYGPDLTHLMARKTLASGIVPNTREMLRDWIIDPQKMKPGCLMAAFGNLGDDVDRIVDYMLSLE